MKQNTISSIGLVGVVGFVWFFQTGCGPGSLEESESEFGMVQQELGEAILPNWATESESKLRDLEGPPQSFRANRPPPGNFRLPAEFEPTQAVVVTWTSYTSLLREISKEVAMAGAQVWAVGGPSSITDVPPNMYQRLSFSYNSVWSRDYGPVGINQETLELGIVDTTYRHYASRRYDDAIPCQVAGFAGVECYTTDLILDGGNLMVDGQGNLFMTNRTYVWNSHLSQTEVDRRLRDYFNVHTIHRFEYAQNYGSPADGTGHIDMFAKLLSECQVLVAESNQSPYSSVLNGAAAYFSNLECAPGRTYVVYRIPGWSSSGTWYTYTNSLIVNDTVLVPWYSGGENAQAQSIYQAALPNHRIVMIPSDGPISSGGSIHCVTKEIPAAGSAQNQRPFAHAGEDQSVAPGEEVMLDGSESYDPDAQVLQYYWTQTMGPNVVLDDPSSATPRFVVPVLGEFVELKFRLVVNDGLLDSEPDEVVIRVKPDFQLDWVSIKASDTPIFIPDNKSSGIQSQMVLPVLGDIVSLEVEVHIEHTYIGDLQVSLICPSGTRIVLHDRTGGSADDIHRNYQVTGCNDQSANGTWTLKVSDHASSDVGTLESWSLEALIKG